MINYVETAKNIVDNLRKRGVPSWVTGGVAIDMLEGLNRNHKDIDIFVKDSKHSNKVKQTMKEHGYELKVKNGNHREYYFNKNRNLGIDVFYNSLFFGKHIPTELNENDYVVDRKALASSLKDKAEEYKQKYEQAMYNYKIASRYVGNVNMPAKINIDRLHKTKSKPPIKNIGVISVEKTEKSKKTKEPHTNPEKIPKEPKEVVGINKNPLGIENINNIPKEKYKVLK